MHTPPRPRPTNDEAGRVLVVGDRAGRAASTLRAAGFAVTEVALDDLVARAGEGGSDVIVIDGSARSPGAGVDDGDGADEGAAFDAGFDDAVAAATASLQARPSTSSVPVLVVSPRGGRRARRRGVDAWLSAPVDTSALVGAVDVLLTLGTERQAHREAEQQAAIHETLQAAAYEQINDSIIVTDVGGTVMQWNRGAERIFGWSAAEMLGKSLAAIHPEPGPDLRDALRRLDAGPPEAGTEWQGRTKSGENVWLHVHTTPVRDRSGAIVAYVGVSKDITDKRLANDLLRTRLELERHLIGMVSHDLRNPLNAIVLSVALLERLQLPEKGMRGVERISRATKRSLRLIDDLLDFTRARRGDGMPVERTHGDLKDLLNIVIDDLRPLHPGRDVVVDADAAPGDYDEGRMTQVLQNLVGNALQHTTAGAQVRVTLKTDGDDVTMVVWNNGPPIAPEVLPHLFAPYQQGPHTGRGADRSLGLGLFIAREAIKAHGGTVDVTSDSEKGTAFSVRMRRRAPPPTIAPGPAGPTGRTDPSA